MSPEITRSPGTIVTIGNMPAIVGGGYRGLTDELDAVVARAADLLRETFNQDVEIRFNSDRQSGGAWLVTPQRSDFWRNGEVGLGAGLYAIDRPDVDEWLALSYAEREAWPREIVIDTLLTAQVMRHPEQASPVYGADRDSVEGRRFSSVEAAIAYLSAEVDPAKLGTTQPRQRL